MAIGLSRTAMIWSNVNSFRPDDTRLTLLFPGDNYAAILTQLQNLSTSQLVRVWSGVTFVPPAVALAGAGYQSVKWQAIINWQTGSIASTFGSYQLELPAPQQNFLQGDLHVWDVPPFSPNASLDNQVILHGQDDANRSVSGTAIGQGAVFHRTSSNFSYLNIAANFCQSVIWRDRLGQTVMLHMLQTDRSPDILTELQNRSNAFAVESFIGPPINPPPSPGALGNFVSVFDQAELRFRCFDGTQAKVVVPAPERALFDASQERVDSGVATPLISELIGHARGLSGSLFLDYLGGKRSMDNRY